MGAIAERDKINRQYFFIGEIQDKKKMYDFINGLDVVIIASRDESCSLVVLESAMLGKAILLNSNIGAKYMVSSKNGYICENNSVISLKDGMTYIYHKRRKIKKMGVHSRKMYKKFASESVYYKNLKKIIGENT